MLTEQLTIDPEHRKHYDTIGYEPILIGDDEFGATVSPIEVREFPAETRYQISVHAGSTFADSWNNSLDMMIARLQKGIIRLRELRDNGECDLAADLAEAEGN